MRNDRMRRPGGGIPAVAALDAAVLMLALSLAGGCTCRDGPKGTDSAPGTDAGADTGMADSGGTDGAATDSGGADAGADSSVTTDAAATDAGAGTPCGTLTCNAATQICVVDVAFGSTYACEPVPPGCESDRTCACVGPTVCTGGFDVCIDSLADNTVMCECPTC